MNRNRVSAIALILLAAAFLVFTLLNNVWLSGIRLDLTENKLFTLSAGTREITAQIDEPINLYFFFSEKASEDLTTLRAYATRVRELLQEYALLADGKINLQLIDPQPSPMPKIVLPHLDFRVCRSTMPATSCILDWLAVTLWITCKSSVFFSQTKRHFSSTKSAS